MKQLYQNSTKKRILKSNLIIIKMKKNKILLAALASAAIVGCTDDSLVEVQNNAIDGLLLI